ncbi:MULTISPECIES: hypothetical protein [unclassified Psychrobacter]|uniref:hypothetical protein n=1 Tax=unclassified Psychrobacter TaxID=196806 RepID=UPI0018F3DD03|nr:MULTISPECIES: hypothetical protein [unclassified Psychrobacter]
MNETALRLRCCFSSYATQRPVIWTFSGTVVITITQGDSLSCLMMLPLSTS